MRTCREVVEILSSDKKLTLWGKIELKLHLMICKSCSKYLSQIRALRDTYKELFKQITELSPVEVKKLQSVLTDMIKK